MGFLALLLELSYASKIKRRASPFLGKARQARPWACPLQADMYFRLSYQNGYSDVNIYTASSTSFTSALDEEITIF